MAAAALILMRVLTAQQAYRGISWTIVILIAGMIPLSTAMRQTGAADDIADTIVSSIGDGSPYVLLVALFILVALLGQVISNTATALIIMPVAVAAALEMDVSVQPVLMSVNVAAHASFLTPIATTPNLMVLEPGGYRFGDYWKFGLPLMLLYFVVSVGLVPLAWPF
jgi:di/tricarboxylate transporter